MTIQEELEKLNAQFDLLYDSFLSIEKEKDAENQIYTTNKEYIMHDKYTEERQRLEEEKQNVLKYYRIAKENSLIDIVVTAPPIKPDFFLLNSLIEKIVDSDNNDPTARRIVSLSGSYISFINVQISNIDKKIKIDLHELEIRYSDTLKRLAVRRKSIICKCHDYLNSQTIKNLVDLFGHVQMEYEVTESILSNWNPAKKKKMMMLLGFCQYRVNSPLSLSPDIKKIFGKYFDEKTRSILCPIGYRTDVSFRVSIDYYISNEDKLKKGIQAILSNYIRYFPIHSLKITIIDNLNYNSDLLGELVSISGIRDGVFDRIPSTKKEVQQTLSILSNYYKSVEERIGSQSVFEYNKHCSPTDTIPYRVLVLREEKNIYSNTVNDDLMYLTNNLQRFGIFFFYLRKCQELPDDSQFQKMVNMSSSNSLFIRSENGISFQLYNIKSSLWENFAFLDFVDSIPQEYINRIRKGLIKQEIGTNYFKRYKPTIPNRSKGKRRPIEIPFAIDNNDSPILCSFENELFAAYMMGAARSGKSTLLHTMICGLTSRYHPDELELWLLDFKMLEFKRYVNHHLPHVKYVLLEKSEDLIFDIVDQLEKELMEREYIFSQNGWYKLTDVPPTVYMPAIFVIMDEFAQMSQVLKETKGEGLGKDYTLKIANLLQKGAAMGFKFIFASQTYSDGVEGLTEPARKQIQLRFALKNVPQEIKDTLMLTSGDIDDKLERDIATLPPYECIYKWRDLDNRVRIDRLRNMYAEDDKINYLVETLNRSFLAVKKFCYCDEHTYKDKHPIYIDGNFPKSFKSQIPDYKLYEASLSSGELDSSDVLIYAGVPCSFNPANPFVLTNSIAENIIVAGGNIDETVSVLLSILISYKRSNGTIELWTHERSPIYRKFGHLLSSYELISDLSEICEKIKEIKTSVQKRMDDEKLIVVFGYDRIINDMELLADEDFLDEEDDAIIDNSDSADDLSSIMQKLQACTNPEEKRLLIDQYNASVNSVSVVSRKQKPKSSIYDARDDFKWILKRASNYGVHFLFCCLQPREFIDTKTDSKSFQHKLLFSMSRDDSYDIIGNRKASEIPGGTVFYYNGIRSITMRPHIHHGVPNNGWLLDSRGNLMKE